jgi:hypothetical protein
LGKFASQQGGYARDEEVFCAAKHMERLNVIYPTSDPLFLNFEDSLLAVLQPDHRVAFVSHSREVPIIDPLLLQKLDSGHRPGADEQEDCAARHFVICFGQRVRIVWWSIRRASPDDPMYVDVGQAREFRVSRVHAPDMTSERHLR